MRTDVVAIRLSDTTARDAQKGCGGTHGTLGKVLFLDGPVDRLEASVVSRLFSPFTIQSDAGQTCVEPRYTWLIMHGSGVPVLGQSRESAPEPFICMNGLWK
jgi:hypothetical protein